MKVVTVIHLVCKAARYFSTPVKLVEW